MNTSTRFNIDNNISMLTVVQLLKWLISIVLLCSIEKYEFIWKIYFCSNTEFEKKVLISDLLKILSFIFGVESNGLEKMKKKRRNILFFIQIYLLIFPVDAIAPPRAGYKFVKTLRNRRLVGFVHTLSENVQSRASCVVKCASTDGCHSVNYHVEKLHCVVNTNVKTNQVKQNMQTEEKWEYYEKSIAEEVRLLLFMLYL